MHIKHICYCFAVKCQSCDQAVLESDTQCYGCDVSGCDRWFHRHCLDAGEQAQADLSVMVSTDWVCPYCTAKVDRQCTVCLEEVTFLPDDATRHEAEEGWVVCASYHCKRWYHLACLPTWQVEYYLQDASSWLCPECGEVV